METRIVDRSEWRAGEWDNEPENRVDFVHAGFACFILRGPLGAWCGYVGVPSTHSLYENTDVDDKVDVHGGVTYTEKCAGAICHVPEPGMPDDVWWIGFDTAHYMDVTPHDYHKFGLGYEAKGTYKNIKYVTDEVKSLAEQLEKL